jgi:hypothetical protein
MADLAQIQREFSQALLADRLGSLRHLFTAGQADAGARLSIFRNNTLISLTEALKAAFPVTVQLADERFFAYAASRFIASCPPSEARLSQFGAAFPRFLAGFEPCRRFPIIAEMASLEWALASSLGAAELMPAPIDQLTLLDPGGPCVKIALQPHLRLVLSRWSLLDVWSAHKSGPGAVPGTLRRVNSRIAVMRHGEDLQFLPLEPSRFGFWRSLSRGLTLDQATARALARDPLFDLVSEMLLLFRMKLVTGFSPQLPANP